MDDAYSKVFLCLSELNETELEALAGACQKRVEERRKARHESLRQELMKNLQNALSDILHNGFSLTIKNTERNHEYDDFDEVYFDPEDIYSIEIE